MQNTCVVLVSSDASGSLGKACERDSLSLCKYYTSNGFNEAQIFLISSPAITYKNKIHSINANRKNLISVLQCAIQNFDCIIFHYSGHGSQTRDLNHDELDGLDECLILEDGVFSDDDLYLHLVKPLNDNQRVIAFFDACHSGSMLDLKFQWMGKDKKPVICNQNTSKCQFSWSVSACSDAQCAQQAIGDFNGFGGSLTSALLNFNAPVTKWTRENELPLDLLEYINNYLKMLSQTMCVYHT